ncbi:MAG: hypothetical protein AAF533_03780 [Acidobacteriota bacterium]
MPATTRSLLLLLPLLASCLTAEAAPVQHDCGGNAPIPKSYGSCAELALAEPTVSNGCYELLTAVGGPHETRCEFRDFIVVLVDNSDSPPHSSAVPRADMEQRIADWLEYWNDTTYDGLILRPKVVWDESDPANPGWFELPGVGPSFSNDDIFAQVIAQDSTIAFTDYDLIMTITTMKQGASRTGNCIPGDTQQVPISPDPTILQVHPAHYILVRNANAKWTFLHELGHAMVPQAVGYGGTNLNHASCLSSLDGGQLEYADGSDIMSESGHLSAPLKRHLGYLPHDMSVDVADQLPGGPPVTTSVTLNALAPNQHEVKAVRLPLSHPSATHAFWVEARRLTADPLDDWDEQNDPILSEGVLVKWVNEKNGVNPPLLVARDGSPETPANRLEDGALLPGRTHSEDGVSITVEGTSSTSADLFVHRGPRSGVLPNVSVNVTNAGAPCWTVEATSSDPAAADWAYFWNFEVAPGERYEPGTHGSGPITTHCFEEPVGPWRVWLIVSDKTGCERWLPFDIGSAGSVSLVDTNPPNITGIHAERRNDLDHTLTVETDDTLDRFLSYHWIDSAGVSSSYPELDVDHANPGVHSVSVGVSVGAHPCGVLPTPQTVTYEIGREWVLESFDPVNTPTGRTGHAMAFNTYCGKTTMFGGFDGTMLLDETWEKRALGWNFKDAAACAQAQPSARHGAALSFAPGTNKLLLFGGEDAAGNLLDDEWHRNCSVCWASVQSATVPPARRSHAMAKDSANGQVVLFGGLGASGLLGDTWVHDGTDWTQVIGPGPTPRKGHVMTYDPDRQVVVMRGGFTDGPPAGLWTFDGATLSWTDETPTSADPPYGIPGRRVAAAMSHDPIANRVVLFGGNNLGQVQDGTWEWNDEGWTDMTMPSSAPSARRGAAMVWDAGREQLILFGGHDGGSQYFDETWTSTP